ncbi:MAG: DUF5407 family protein [Verrucomicrobia bacterium]|nr:DUF5407 family protein [Verrucomicrobiota bacterium]
MTLNLSKLLTMISAQAKAVSAKMGCLACQGTSISVVGMISLQLAMNKFSQIADLGSTTVTLFNQTFQNMISNVLR